MGIQKSSKYGVFSWGLKQNTWWFDGVFTKTHGDINWRLAIGDRNMKKGTTKKIWRFVNWEKSMKIWFSQSGILGCSRCSPSLRLTDLSLVGGLVAIFYFPIYWVDFIIPIDFHIFQRGFSPTTNQYLLDKSEAKTITLQRVATCPGPNGPHGWCSRVALRNPPVEKVNIPTPLLMGFQPSLLVEIFRNHPQQRKNRQMLQNHLKSWCGQYCWAM